MDIYEESLVQALVSLVSQGCGCVEDGSCQWRRDPIVPSRVVVVCTANACVCVRMNVSVGRYVLYMRERERERERERMM